MLSDFVLSVLSVCDFGALWPTGWTDQDETWLAGIGIGPGHIVLDGDPAPLPKGAPHQFLVHICCSQMTAWIKIPVSNGGRPRTRRLCVRRGPRSPSPKPKFSAQYYCGQTAGWIKMALGMEAGLIPGDFVLEGDPSLLPRNFVGLYFHS